MEIKVSDGQEQPLLLPPPDINNINTNNDPVADGPCKPSKTQTQKVIRKTLKNTTRLSSLLPTGSVLALEMLSPALTNRGQCKNVLTTAVAAAFLFICAIFCFISCFADSVRDARGKVRYGFATWTGLWVVDGSVRLVPDEAWKYRIRAVDFFHGIMSVLVFGGVALLDHNVVACLFPEPSDDMKKTLVGFPVGVGMVASLMFMWFPSKRHGVNNPLSRT